MARTRALRLLAVALALQGADASARVERIEILARDAFDGGRAQGAVGAYERIKGRLHYVVDPAAPANARIVDLALAPRDARGLVTFAGEFILLAPVAPERGSRRLLAEVTNRGNLGMLDFFNYARWSNDPLQAAHAGDRFLMSLGHSLLWTGWNWDVVPGDGRLQIELPIAHAGGRPISGQLAAEIVVERPTAWAPVAWGNSRGYPAVSLDPLRSLLTLRESQRGSRRPVPAEEWAFARRAPGGLDPSPTHIALAGGFRPGIIYELTYEATDARVVGLGLAALRDALTFFRFEAAGNPLWPALPERTILFGISQSGRVIQHLLYEGLHRDEAGRPAFDAAFVHVAGGGKGSFNHRFAQTTRHASQHEDHGYPADFFPFATVPDLDPVTGQRGSVLDRVRAAGAVPHLFYTTTSTEYWTRSASLLHADVTGTRDLGLDAQARLYFIAGAQHNSGLTADLSLYRACGNPLDHRPIARALLVALDRWLSEGAAPPASVYPRLEDGTLGTLDAYRARFPGLPGLATVPGHLRPPRLDLGPRFAAEGVAELQPARLLDSYETLLPLPDADGIDRGGIRLPAVAVPLGTFTGWNLRRAEFAQGAAIGRWAGSFIPFARDAAEAAANRDPRPPLAARYANADAVVAGARAAADALVRDGFLLPTDAGRLAAEAGANYRQVLGRPTAGNCAYLAGWR